MVETRIRVVTKRVPDKGWAVVIDDPRRKGHDPAGDEFYLAGTGCTVPGRVKTYFASRQIAREAIREYNQCNTGEYGFRMVGGLH